MCVCVCFFFHLILSEQQNLVSETYFMMAQKISHENHKHTHMLTNKFVRYSECVVDNNWACCCEILVAYLRLPNIEMGYLKFELENEI